jgi:hypothetical protein
MGNYRCEVNKLVLSVVSRLRTSGFLNFKHDSNIIDGMVRVKRRQKLDDKDMHIQDFS